MLSLSCNSRSMNALSCKAKFFCKTKTYSNGAICVFFSNSAKRALPRRFSAFLPTASECVFFDTIQVNWASACDCFFISNVKPRPEILSAREKNCESSRNLRRFCFVSMQNYETARLDLPLARRRLIIIRPPKDLIRAKNPCLRTRFLLFGCQVRFDIEGVLYHSKRHHDVAK